MKNFFDKLFKLAFSQTVLYLFFGVLTTAVSFGTFYIFGDLLEIYYLHANIIAWVFAVSFAYVTNKLWVFKSKCGTPTLLMEEILLFVGARIFSLVIEEIGLFIFVDIFFMNSNIAKLILQFVIVVLNYIFSKLFIFK